MDFVLVTFLNCLLTPSIILVVYIIVLISCGKLKNGEITSQLSFQILIAVGYFLPHFSSTTSRADKASDSFIAL